MIRSSGRSVAALALTLAAWAAAPALASSAKGADDDPWIESRLGELMTLYKHLHTHPELSLYEAETAKRIADELEKAGFQTTRSVGKHGVVGVLRNGDGPTVLVRTDLDALPVIERTGLPYASQVKVKDEAGAEVGVMHACGHDMHMTVFVGVARWLAEHRDRWKGTALLIGQPAEERVMGAKAMLDDGLYVKFPKPNYALALHVQSDLEVGKIGFTKGASMAGSTAVDIVVRGRGGHGAMPHNTVDPIVLSALLVLDLQTIVSREVSPIKPSVITVGSIHGGSKHNIISDQVELKLTLRAFEDKVRDQLIEGIERRAKALAKAHNAPEPTIRASEGTPPTINTPALVDRILPVLKAQFGEDGIVEGEATMGAEDFGLFSQGGVPIFMMRLGTVAPEKVAAAKAGDKPLPSLHSAEYAPIPEPSIRAGVRAMTAAITELMPPK